MSEVAGKALKYIESITAVLSDLKTRHSLQAGDVQYVLDTAERYVTDAQYYLRKDDASTALASVSYAEGLLDALKFLRHINFEWPSKKVNGTA